MPAPALRELQALFWRGLEGSAEPDLEAAVASSASLAAGERLAIYARMYFSRLHDLLAEDFEKTAAALGPDRFTDTVRGYLARHPSEHPSVRHLGRHFADFLASAPPPGAPPWLADLARLEWARVETFDAPDALPIERARLAVIPAADWPGLVLVLIPALEVLDSAWPLHRLWRDAVDVAPAATAVRVWRQDGAVYHCAMDAFEREALDLVRAGATFGRVCEAMADLEPEAAAAEAGALLARWVDDGLIAGVR